MRLDNSKAYETRVGSLAKRKDLRFIDVILKACHTISVSGTEAP